MANQNAPFWRTANNVMFYAGSVMPWPGAANLFAKSISKPVTGLLELDPQATGEPAVAFGTDSNLYYWENTAGQTTEGSGYTGAANQVNNVRGDMITPASRWSLQQWNTWVYATNGVNLPQVNKNAGAGFVAADVDSLFTTCEIFHKWKQFLIGFNLSTGKNHIRFCDTDNPEVWTPSLTNSARGLFAQDVVAIRAVREMSEAILYYGDDSLNVLEYIGGTKVFGTHRLLRGVGAYGKNTVCSAPDGMHYGWGPRGIWRTDGHSAEYIDGPAIQRYIKQTLNVSQASKIACYFDGQIKHVVFSYPSLTSAENDLMLAFNTLEPKWVPGSFGRSVMSDEGKFAAAVSGGRTGDIYIQSLLEPVSASLGNPSLPLHAVSATLLSDWGESGFGQLGFGGTLVVVG